MKEDSYNKEDDEMSLKEVILKLQRLYNYLLRKWIIIVFAGIVGCILGVLYARMQKPVYTAECTFVLEESSSGGGMGQYAGLASMMGVNIGNGGTSGIFQGDNILQLYKSRKMIEKTLLSAVNIKGRTSLLIDRYLQINKLRDRWLDKPKLRNIDFSIPREKYNINHDSIINRVVDDINRNYLSVQKPDKKLSIISVEVKSRDELFAKIFTEKIVENVNDFYVQTKTKKSTENVQLLERQADSVRRALDASIGNSASAMDANPNSNPALQILRVPSQKKQIDVQSGAAIYTEVVKNLEIARISLRREAPLIQVIDTPILPLPVKNFSKLIGGVAGFMVFVFLTSSFFILKKTYNRIMTHD